MVGDSNMPRMIKPALVLGAAIAAAGALGACSDSGGGTDVVITPDPMPPMGAARFGLGFGQAFALASTAEPTNPAQSDIIPVSLTADPLDVMSPGG